MDVEKNNHGFTLIELIIAMLICVIVMAGIISAFRKQETSHLTQEQVIEMQQSLRGALNIMAKDIRMAGYDPDGTHGSGIVIAGDGSNNANTMKFTYFNKDAGTDNADNDNDGTKDESGEELQTIEYYIYDSLSDGNNDIGRRYGARLDAIVKNIATLKFTYLDKSGIVTADISAIRSIKVLIKTQPDINAANFAGGGTRTLTETIKCRNLGLK